ncbi:unnamed protein product [Acanthoscelides obtectus]|uniref:Transcription factor Adf-1 n=1 Tax=Acanthoscelides obtectus TaxID=200917 RepID=A0A9P0L1N1_ACAOB|nr:unnamed protein product [Acanthoscelides obtectus]CAK1643221.1 hypothetical protein AOBTE_LOCUS13452 [Acanthoscelides obtectus]
MAEKVVEFVKLVEAFPCLYNHSLSDYSRKDVTDKGWADIASKMNWTVPECKEKWRNVRNGFVKSLKMLPSGSAAKSRKPYYLYDEMQFVIPFLKPTNNEKDPGNIPLCYSSQSTANSPNAVDTQSTLINDVETQHSPTNEELLDATQPPKKKARPSNNDVNSTFVEYISAKKKHLEKSMQRADTENPRRMFLLSLLPDIENLSNDNMRLLKIDMMSLIHKYHIAEQNQQSPATAAYAQVQPRSSSDIYQQPCQQPNTQILSMRPNQ